MKSLRSCCTYTGVALNYHRARLSDYSYSNACGPKSKLVLNTGPVLDETLEKEREMLVNRRVAHDTDEEV